MFFKILDFLAFSFKNNGFLHLGKVFLCEMNQNFNFASVVFKNTRIPGICFQIQNAPPTKYLPGADLKSLEGIFVFTFNAAKLTARLTAKLS